MGSTVCLTESTPRLLFLPVHPEAKLQPWVWRGSADVCGSASRLLGGMGEGRKLVVLCIASFYASQWDVQMLQSWKCCWNSTAV